MNTPLSRTGRVLLCAACITPAFGQTPLDRAVPYQARLLHSGAAVNGAADLQFRVFDAPSDGAQIGPTHEFGSVGIADGLFTVPLDLGVGVLTGDDRYMEIAVRAPAGSGNYIILTPRQRLAPAPYALKLPGRDGHSLDGQGGSPADALYVSSFGEVGIGTTLALGPLDVRSGNQSYVRVDAVHGDLHMNGGTDRVAGIYNDSTGADARTDFLVNNWPQMVINGAGGVGIGTVTPLRRFTVVDGGIFTARFEGSHPFYNYVEFANTTSNATWLLLARGSPGAPAAGGLAFQRQLEGGPSEALSILANSWVGLDEPTPDFRLDILNCSCPTGRARANAWTTYSSARWKDNIRTLDGALGTVTQLRGVSFDWKPEHGGVHDIGFVAEEVGKVVPELVAWEKDGPGGCLAYDRVTALTVEAIKEQQSRLESQRHQIDTLERANNELRADITNMRRVLAPREGPTSR